MTPESAPSGPWCAAHDTCPECGRAWYPTLLGDPGFAGSACEMGACVCRTCEDGDECPRHSSD